MKKILLLILIALFSLSPIYAGDYQDVAISLGTDSTYGEYGPYDFEDSLRLTASFSLGLTSRLETSLGIKSELTPLIASENTLFLEFSYALFGERSTASKVAGTAMNTLISLGGFYSFRAYSEPAFQGAGVYLSITPLALGTPATGMRERFLKTNVGYDFINNRVTISFSIITFDFYLRGMYRG